MAVRRLDPEQPAHFAFSPENLAWAKAQIAKFPQGKQASALIPLLWRAQEQDGWLSEPAIRAITDMLGMAHIRGLEVATFYTMFQLSPVGAKAHVQVCGTTPCMLRGAGALIETCKKRISDEAQHLSPCSKLSWEEVECIGVCANAAVVQIGKDTYEDLTPQALETVLDTIVAGDTPMPGSQIGRTASCPEGGATTLTEASLYDGSGVGAWKKRFEETGGAHAAHVAAAAPVSPPATPAAAKPAVNPGALAAMANAGLVKELNERGQGKPLSTDELAKMKTGTQAAPLSPAQLAAVTADAKSGASPKPELLVKPRGGKGDDLALIWGVAEKLAEKLNALGIWHFDQIAAWTPENVAWFETVMGGGFKGRVERDKWIEQCAKLATGWRPDSDVGERPKG